MYSGTFVRLTGRIEDIIIYSIRDTRSSHSTSNGISQERSTLLLHQFYDCVAGCSHDSFVCVGYRNGVVSRFSTLRSGYT